MKITLCIPLQEQSSTGITQSLVDYVIGGESCDETRILFLEIQRSRLLWNEVYGIVSRANPSIFRTFVSLLVPMFRPQSTCGRMRCAPTTTTVFRTINALSGQKFSHMLFVFVPSPMAKLEYFFEERLIHLERKLILAQSLAGFFATIGGGYFMCHHWKTALQLARQQQQMAIFLGDSSMFYKCLVNQAYNYIYAGKFKRARQLLHRIEIEAPHDPVLLKMCYSARLLSARVKKAKLFRDGQISSNVDDFARIRLVDDKSTTTDRVYPFQVERSTS